MKTIDLISNLRRNPSEFRDRVSAILSVRWELSFYRRPDYPVVALENGVDLLLRELGRDFTKALDESNLTEIERRITERLAELPENAPFGKFHNGDTRLGRICYAVARSVRPRTVIETGVCYGVTSAFILAALDVNKQGHLHSIDLPPLGKNADDYVGWLVPNELRSLWTLRRGTSRKLMRPLIAELGSIDLFIHDSLHTYKNMKHEFKTVWPALRSGGVLISDDIEGNEVFLELMKSGEPAFSLVLRSTNKDALLGVAVKR